MKRAILKLLIALLLISLLTSCTMAQPTGIVDDNLLGLRNQTQEPYTGMFSNPYAPVTSTPLPQGSLMFVDVDEANALRAEREERKHDPFLFVEMPEPIVIDKPTDTPPPVYETTPPPEKPSTPTPVPNKTEPSTYIFELCGSVGTRYAYQQLTQKQKELFSELYDGIVENQASIQIKGTYPYSDYIRVYRAINFDCPELFNIKWPMKCYVSANSVDEFVSRVEPQYYMSNSEYKQRLEIVIGKIKGMSSAASFGSTDVDHEIYIQRYLIENVTYVLQEDARRADRAYLDGYAKCDGYSNATMLALRYYGIPCLNITGWTYEQDGKRADNAHQWNMVQLGGNWYHLDTTWNDRNGNFPFVLQTSQSKHVYFLPYMNTSDARMLHRRTVDMESNTWDLPKANTETLSYYRMNGLSVRNTEDARNNLSSQISNIAQNGGEYAIAYFDKPSDVDAFVSSVQSFINGWKGWNNERINRYYYNYWSDIGVIYLFDMSFR
ncbi:MAG: hypothetical protein E7323_01055 [Clostridiales bacterium]|nr:hypothetical protein [Clostridiales bacterium]